jgi:hypothetical protein
MWIRRVLHAATAGLAAAILGAAGVAVPAQADPPPEPKGRHLATRAELDRLFRSGDATSALDASWYFITNVWSGLNLSVSGGSTSPGAPFIQWPERRGSNGLPAGYQAFTWTQITGNWYAYRVASTSSWYALAISGGSTANGAPAIQWNFEAAPTHNYEQQWVIDPDGGTGNFHLKNRKSQKCLAVRDATQGTAITQQPCTATDKQLFYFDD